MNLWLWVALTTINEQIPAVPINKQDMIYASSYHTGAWPNVQNPPCSFPMAKQYSIHNSQQCSKQYGINS